MKKSETWLEYTVYVSMPHLDGVAVPMCGLCGNCGVVDTTMSAKAPGGQSSGIRGYCICPNGRARKKQHDKAAKAQGKNERT